MGSALVALQRDNEATHRAAHDHPVVRRIGDGTLPEATFRFYLEQDYQFLLRYARVLARAVAAAPDAPTATRLAELLQSTLAVEIDTLVELYATFGGERAALDAAVPAPACQAYNDHLLATAAGGELAVILAAILPCQWGYREIGQALAARGLPEHPGYARWIGEYASAEYGALVDWVAERFDELEACASEAARREAARVYALSSRYELAFWEMAGTGQRWEM